MIRTVLFDLGNVLLSFSHERMCRQVAEVCGISSGEARQVLFGHGIEEEFERGALTERAVHARLEELLGRPLDFERLLHAGADIFEPRPAMLALVRQLKAAGMRLVLLSNTNSAHIRHIRQTFELLEHFDHLVLSYEVGALKPEPAIFDAALRAIKCDPGECLYTDDIAPYVEAGRERGLTGVVFTSIDDFFAELRKRKIIPN